MRIRIGTRSSALARWQSLAVRDALRASDAALDLSIHEISSHGDIDRSSPLAAPGMTGFFTKRIEEALLCEEIDVAVHSLKDLPSEPTPGLRIAAVLKRADPRDAIVSGTVRDLADLPSDAQIITGSPRRRAQILALHPGATFAEIRGNIPTRLEKFDRSGADAMILAAAGLQRLGLSDRIAAYIPTHVLTPAAGQGIVAVECRETDDRILAALVAISDEAGMMAAAAERAFMRRVGGGCRVPIGVYARREGTRLQLEAVVLSPDGRQVLRDRADGEGVAPESLGEDLAERMLSNGAQELLAANDSGSELPS